VVFVVALAGSRVQGPHVADTRVWWPVAAALIGVSCAVLPLHDRRPVAVAVVVSAGTLALAALGALLTPPLLAPLLVALYWLVVGAGWRTGAVFCAAVGALLAVTAVVAAPLERPWELETLAPLVWLSEPVFLGGWDRLRRACLRLERARAEQAERSREQEARARVAEERARIARELHDAVAHHLALANAQAGTAAHLLRARPDQVEAVLTQLARSTSAALHDLKAAVGVLRQPDDPDAPLEPPPGLTRLPELASSCGSAGLAVTVAVEGTQRPLPAGVDLTAFRVVQEALTNVGKHAAATSAQVRLVYGRDRLTVTVADAGPGSGGPPALAGRRVQPAAGSGFGLVGLRERARSVGGHLVAGPRPGGGFVVTAELPLRAEEDGAR
jgi:signal transduction histidine kinase